MDITTRRARITGPVSYLAGSGRKQNIPVGPCLAETLGGRSIDIIWGTRGQRSVAFPVEAIERAQDHGHLVRLDGRSGTSSPARRQTLTRCSARPWATPSAPGCRRPRPSWVTGAVIASVRSPLFLPKLQPARMGKA